MNKIKSMAIIGLLFFAASPAHAALSTDDHYKIAVNPPLEFMTCNVDSDCQALYDPCVGWRPINQAHAKEWITDARLGGVTKDCVLMNMTPPHASCLEKYCALKVPPK